jgi:formylglycine-generating enzyme required for sulfatase activity
MPARRAYDGTLSEFTGASDIDWTGLTIVVDYSGGDPDVEIVYDGSDSRFTFTSVTFAPVSGSPGAYSKPAAPGASLALNATVSFTDTGELSAQTTTLDTDTGPGSLLAPTSRYIYVANLPIATYFKAGEAGDVMVDVPTPGAPTPGYVSTPAQFGIQFRSTVAANPIAVSAYRIAKFETTEKLYNAVMDWAVTSSYNYARGGAAYSGRSGLTGTSTLPMRIVSWHQAVTFCNALSEMTGKQPVYVNAGAVVRSTTTAASDIVKQTGAKGYRLPTAVEWEYAALGGDQNNVQWHYKFSGSNTASEVAVFDQPSAPSNTGSKQSNRLGLYDMSGNMGEWVDRKNQAATTVPVFGNSHETANGVGELNKVGNQMLLTSSSMNTGFRLASD